MMNQNTNVLSHYSCELCSQRFATLRDYVNHFTIHQEPFKDIESPKLDQKGKKLSFWSKLFNKRNTEVAPKMADDKKAKEIEDIERQMGNMDARFTQLETSIRQLSDIISDKNSPPTQPEQPTPPPTTSGGKNIQVTLMIPEKQSGDFLKTVQEKGYSIEDISVQK